MKRVLLTLALTACGSRSTFTGSCNNGALGVCNDFDSQLIDDAANIRMSCALLGGSWALQTCPRAGVVGGCQVNRADSGTQTSWYAPSSGLTADEVMSQCSNKGGTFVTP